MKNLFKKTGENQASFVGEEKKSLSVMSRVAHSKRVKYGGYATVLVLVVIAALVIVNIGVSALTTNVGLQLDLTRNRKYTLSETSKSVVSKVNQDVYIYAMFSETVKSNYPDYTKLFENLSDASDYIHVEYIDPTKNPTFANQFIGGTVTSITAGSVIVSRADAAKFRVLTSYDFYDYKYDSNYNVTATAFKGEDALANALIYVNSNTSPKVYWYSGHGETPITSYSEIQTFLQRENYECKTIESVSLNTLGAADTLVVTAPQRDISEEELEQLKIFMNNGGRLIYLSTPGIALANFEELMEVYGIGFGRDVVLESSASYYYYAPTIIVPTLQTHDVTSTLRTNKLAAYIPNTHSLVSLDLRNSALTVEPLLITSNSSYGKVNLQFTIAEKEENDKVGPFTVGMAATYVNDYNEKSKDAKLVVFGSSAFLTQYYYMGGNADLFLQAVRYMQNESTEVVSIIGKSMLEDTLSFTSYAQLYTAAAIAAIGIPVLVLLCGVVVWLRRRHL